MAIVLLMAKQFYEQLTLYYCRNIDHWMGIGVLCFCGRKHYPYFVSLSSYSYSAALDRREQESNLSTLE
jgi:hypothetical protein